MFVHLPSSRITPSSLRTFHHHFVPQRNSPKDPASYQLGGPHRRFIIVNSHVVTRKDVEFFGNEIPTRSEIPWQRTRQRYGWNPRAVIIDANKQLLSVIASSSAWLLSMPIIPASSRQRVNAAFRFPILPLPTYRSNYASTTWSLHDYYVPIFTPSHSVGHQTNKSLHKLRIIVTPGRLKRSFSTSFPEYRCFRSFHYFSFISSICPL